MREIDLGRISVSETERLAEAVCTRGQTIADLNTISANPESTLALLNQLEVARAFVLGKTPNQDKPWLTPNSGAC